MIRTYPLLCQPKISQGVGDVIEEDNVPYDTLPFEAQLNVDCDIEAKNCMQTVRYDGSRPEPPEGTKAALYLNDFLVTTELEEQIHYAAHARPLLAYVRDKFEWTDSEIDGINWRAIGHAKARLKLNDNVRISKMMHDWLNVGKQKRKFDHLIYDGRCPCCGNEEEDTVHLYRCTHADMRSALEDGLDEMESNLREANVPNASVSAFLDQFRRITGSTREKQSWVCRLTDKAVEHQEALGSNAILRGHHHKQWCYTIMDTYRPRKEPPRTRESDKKKKHIDRNPLEMSALLVEETWKLFNKLWEARNTILHGTDSYEAKLEDSQRTEQLLTYRRRRHIVLAPGDCHLIEHPVRDIISWDRHRKKRLLKVLDTCRAKYAEELKGSKTQRDLTSFGFTRTLTMDIAELEPD